MVKGKSSVWDHFISNYKNPKNIKSTCKYCQTTVQGLKRRMEEHLKKCRSRMVLDNSDDENTDDLIGVIKF